VGDGRLKFAALTRYFDARKKLEMADSLLFVLTDTTKKTISDKIPAILSDTLEHNGGQVLSQSNPSNADSLPLVSDSIKPKIETVASRLTKSRADSLKVLRSLLDSTQHTIAQTSSRRSHIGPDSLNALKSTADSIQHKISLVSSQLTLSSVDSLQYIKTQTTSQPVRLSADSLNVLKSIAAQDLGDIFYTEVVVPDSAFTWYEKSLTWNYSPIRSPRILYILAELSRMNAGKKYSTPEEYYTRLGRDFPESMYAEEARRFLGKESSVKKVDNAVIYYEQAEKQIDTKQYKNAIKTFHNIAQLYSKSPLAAKSEYAIGWVLENHLAQPESALVQYKHVVKKYDGTKYAIAAARRSAGLVQSNNVKLDTARVNGVKTDTSRIHSAAIDSTKINTMKIDTIKINKGKIDTSKNVKVDTAESSPMKIDTSKVKITEIDSSEIRPSPVNQKALHTAGARKDSVVSRKEIIE
jgi:tetratricopeptide (TPR) repeat protein